MKVVGHTDATVHLDRFVGDVKFSTDIHVTNAAEPNGIRLIDVVYHLECGPGNIFYLIVPESPPARSSIDASEEPPNNPRSCGNAA